MIAARRDHHPMRLVGNKDVRVLKKYGLFGVRGRFLRDLSRIQNGHAMAVWRMDRDGHTVFQRDLAVGDSLTPRLRRDVRKMSDQVFQYRSRRGVELRKMESRQHR